MQTAVLLHLAVPIGEPSSGPGTQRTDVRDPAHVIPNLRLTGRFEPAVDLPEDAHPTGFFNGTIELWTAESTFDREVYVGRAGAFEAWPRSLQSIACG